MRPADRGVLALLYELAATPTAGNVDRQREYADLTFSHLLAGAIGAREGFQLAEQPVPIGHTIEIAVNGMVASTGQNTHFGSILLLVPLIRADSTDELSADSVAASIEPTTIDDTVALYRAFESADVGLADPPTSLGDIDARLGTEAIPAIRDRELTLMEFMELSTDHDDIAREWVTDFSRTMEAADRLASQSGSISEQLATVHLSLLADRPDTHILKRHGESEAEHIYERANAIRSGDGTVEELATELVAEGINPGTTADILAGATYVALARNELTP